jgi:hypothetical protein
MRYMLLLKGDPPTGAVPEPKLMKAMGEYTQELVRAGVLLSAEGLHASGTGSRVTLSGGKRTVTDGPFTESKELVAGFYLIQVKSKEEALEWASRCPVEYAPNDGEGAVVEVRLVAEASDFPAV